MTATTPETQWSAGAVIGDRYRLDKLMGRGAMAEVWRAEHVTLETPLAVKLVSVAQDAKAEETMERFLREAQAAAKLRSPHVVQILDHGRQGQSAYIAMELLEGESLEQRMARLGALDPTEVARIASQLARGLEAAHAAGVVHRDLKPANIFLAREQDREVVKILDFGIAKRIDLQGIDKLSTQDGFMVGTPCYMSPEQVMGTRKIDARSDLWQVAVVTFECVCGQRPFDGEAVGELMMSICSGTPPVPSQVAPVPNGFDGWFARATTRDPDARFQSAMEMATALVSILAPHTTAAALADSMPAWAAPATTSSSGVFDRSHAGPLDQSHSTLGTRSGQTWSALGDEKTALSHRRALVTALLIAIPVALAATAGGVWVLTASAGDADAAGEGATVEVVERFTSTSAEATGTVEAAQGSGGAATRAAASADAGPGEAMPPQPGWVPTPNPKPQQPPRRERPEDVLGI